MIINYNEDISKQQFLASKEELASVGIDPPNEGNHFLIGEIDNPRMVYDSNRWNSLENGKLINYLFGHGEIPVGTAYEEVVTFWFKLPGTWPATIDSLAHLRGQKKVSLPKTGECLHVLDIGCGTGIAGNFFAKKNGDRIATLAFADINKYCVSTATMNCIGSEVVSNGFENLKQGKYDVILASAVPAMPIYPGIKREINPLFEGTSFLESILKDSSNHLNKQGVLILSHPSMGEQIFIDLTKRYGAKTKEVYRHEVAFREDFLKDEKWADYLIELGGLRQQEKEGHKYWYDAIVKEIKFD